MSSALPRCASRSQCQKPRGFHSSRYAGHIVRRVPAHRLLVLDIIDAPHDGYDRLCPFLGTAGTGGACLKPGKFTFPGGKDDARRRLVACLCSMVDL